MKPNQIVLRDPSDKEEIDRWPAGKPFEIFGEKVKDDAHPALLLLIQDAGGETQIIGLNVEPSDLKGFDTLIDPRPGSGQVRRVSNVGIAEFRVIDIPKFGTGKEAKEIQSFTVEFI